MFLGGIPNPVVIIFKPAPSEKEHDLQVFDDC